MEIQGWIILNFYTALLLILLLIFQSKNIRTKSGDRFNKLDVMTLILLISETVGHIGELYPDRFLWLAVIGYYIIYAFDPADYLFAILYIDCWIGNEKQSRWRKYFTFVYKVFVVVNFSLITISTVFNLKWFYYFENNTYVRGPMFFARGVLLMLFCIMLSVYTLIYRKSIFANYRSAIFTLPTLSLIGAVLQIFIAKLDMTYASIAIGLLILFFQLQDKNLDIDYMTGCLNRRGLDIRFEEAVRTAQNNGRTFAAIMLDIDRFKSINDNYGHHEGDIAIKTVADILVEVFCNDASIGRFGGDEFCVVTNISDPKELQEKVELLDDELDKWNYVSEKPYKIEVSMGYLIYDADKKMSAEEFVMAIDELMYIQKRKHHLGDNRRQ